MKKLIFSVEKLECDMIDVVNSIADAKPADAKPPATKPAFRNPSDIPDFDKIDIIEEVEVHATQGNVSLVSIEELVPDIDEDVQPRAALNSNVLTNQL